MAWVLGAGADRPRDRLGGRQPAHFPTPGRLRQLGVEMRLRRKSVAEPRQGFRTCSSHEAPSSTERRRRRRRAARYRRHHLARPLDDSTWCGVRLWRKTLVFGSNGLAVRGYEASSCLPGAWKRAPGIASLEPVSVVSVPS